MKEFKASLDTQSKMITAVMAPIFIFIPWILWLSFRNEADRNFEWSLILLGILLVLTFAICYLISPQKYCIGQGNLVIHDRMKKYTYSLSDILKVEKTDTQAMGFLIRMFGNGGIFGYTGYFTSKTFGRMRFFVTNKNKLVLVHLNNGKKIALSPDDQDEFLKAMKSSS